MVLVINSFNERFLKYWLLETKKFIKYKTNQNGFKNNFKNILEAVKQINEKLLI